MKNEGNKKWIENDSHTVEVYRQDKKTRLIPKKDWISSSLF
ncbi:DUF4030 domain-containing protein [Bacillus mycoides]